MLKARLKEKVGKIWRECFLILLLLVQIIVYLNIVHGKSIPYVLSDEFGYLANAAFFAGKKNWAWVMSEMPYYSWGYSIVLSALCYIKGTTEIYQAALYLNVLLLISGWWMLCCISKRLIKDRYIICFANTIVCLYCSNIAFAQTTLAEVFLWYIYICIAFFLILALQEDKTIFYIIFSILSGFISCVHMRAIGVTAAAFFVLLFLTLVDNKKTKKTIISMLCIAVMILIMFVLKSYLMDNTYNLRTITSTNDFSGQARKVSMLVSLKGVGLFIRSILGKLGYLGISTFGLFFIGMAFSVSNLMKHFMNKNLIWLYYAFVFISVLFNLVVSSIFTMTDVGRYDTLLYGRYNEYLLGPVLSLGVMALILDSISLKKAFGIFFITNSLGLYCNESINAIVKGYMYVINIVGISGLSFRDNKYEYDGWIAYVLIFSCFIMFLLLFFNTSQRRIPLFIVLIIVGILWTYEANTIVDNQKSNRTSYETNREIAQYINENNVSEVAYLKNESTTEFDAFLTEIVQYMSPEVCIRYFYFDDDEFECFKYYLIRKGRGLEKHCDGMSMVGESEQFVLFTK